MCCAGQWTWEDQHQIAHALNLPPEKVRVVYHAIGGAFGGREDMSIQIILALAVLRLQERVICADDVGQAINPDQIIGQIEGGIVQAHGYTLLEDFRLDRGHVLTPHFSTYLIPGVYHIPKQVDSIIVEDPHPDGPFGVRGMAEMPYLPYAPAVVAAVHDATGVWFDAFPLTPERVLRGLGKLAE